MSTIPTPWVRLCGCQQQILHAYSATCRSWQTSANRTAVGSAHSHSSNRAAPSPLIVSLLTTTYIKRATSLAKGTLRATLLVNATRERASPSCWSLACCATLAMVSNRLSAASLENLNKRGDIVLCCVRVKAVPCCGHPRARYSRSCCCRTISILCCWQPRHRCRQQCGVSSDKLGCLTVTQLGNSSRSSHKHNWVAASAACCVLNK